MLIHLVMKNTQKSSRHSILINLLLVPSLSQNILNKIEQYHSRLCPGPLCSYVRLDIENESNTCTHFTGAHDDVITWKHFPRYWPFVRGIHRSPVNSPHKGQWRGALVFSLICAWIDDWVNNREAGDLSRHRGHYDVTVISLPVLIV